MHTPRFYFTDVDQQQQYRTRILIFCLPTYMHRLLMWTTRMLLAHPHLPRTVDENVVRLYITSVVVLIRRVFQLIRGLKGGMIHWLISMGLPTKLKLSLISHRLIEMVLSMLRMLPVHCHLRSDLGVNSPSQFRILATHRLPKVHLQRIWIWAIVIRYVITVVHSFGTQSDSKGMIMLEDLNTTGVVEVVSEFMIDATFWDAAATSFNKEAVNSLPSPVIAAVTSMKVTDYYGRLQLAGTPASYIYINPDIDEAKMLAAAFVIRDATNLVLKIDYEKSKKPEVEQNMNRFTIGELLSQNPNRYVGVQFTCRATLTDVNEGKQWYYMACDKCHRKLHRQGDTFDSQDH